MNASTPCIVVDDDPFWLTEICDGLRAEGFHAIRANDADSALKALRAHPDAGLVLDIILPDRDGLEVMGAARALHPNIKVLAISGGGRLGSDFYLKLAGAFGAQATMSKPFSRDALVSQWRDLMAA